MLNIKNFKPTPPLTDAEMWNRITVIWKDTLNEEEHLTEKQRGDIFLSVTSYSQAQLWLQRVTGEDIDYEDILMKATEKLINWMKP